MTALLVPTCQPSPHTGSTKCRPLGPHAPWLQAINSGAEIIETSRCRVDLGRVLGIEAFSLDRVLEQEPDFLEVGLASLYVSKLEVQACPFFSKVVLEQCLWAALAWMACKRL